MTVVIDGKSVDVQPNMTVAAAIAIAGVSGFAPICAMGICYRCRVTIDGVPHRRSCLVECREAMEVRTDAL